MQLVQRLDLGENPDRYVTGVFEEAMAQNQLAKGKTEALREFRALLGEALRPGAWVLSTAPLADARLARRQEGVHVKTSWTGGAKVDVYQVVGAP